MPPDCASLSVFELQPATAVVAAAAGGFRGNACDLAVATNQYVTLYALDEGDVRPVACFDLKARKTCITALVAVNKPAKSG